VWRSSLVWVKNSLVMGRGDYHYRHEVIYYGWAPGAAHHAVTDRTQDTVWEFPRPSASPEHPTMKPVALVERALRNSTSPRQVVLDTFSGSGTTIIAAETLGRRCYAMEIDPKFAQVAIERWQNFTGKEAQKVPSGG
jgi:site-specific DNA-methyltransferase (adenine-specific)